MEPDETVVTTAKTALPLLFSGQAQHEFFINHALTVIDCLLVQTVRGWAAEAPQGVTDGEVYLVGSDADGAWSEHANKLAISVAGDWHFVAPENGQRVYDQSAARMLCFDSGWKGAKAPQIPTGGEVVDSQARATISGLVEALRTVGILEK